MKTFQSSSKKIKLFVFSLACLVQVSSSAQRVATGGWHSLVICTDSTISAFGENASGQLGDGTTTDQNLPVTVNGLNGMIAVSAGGDQLEAHSMGLKSNGTVWCWGSNLYGGLGNGSTINSGAPVQAITLTDVIAISAGGWHSTALKSDGTVWTWGWNSDGQLGDGTLVDKTIPTQVPGLSDVVAISAGTYHVLALKSDGTVWAWGDNVSGQIGDGSNIDRMSPVLVTGLTDIIKIKTGRFFSFAIKSDGTVWTWGENLYGQLGIGSNTDSNIPVQVPGLSGITSAIAATGAFHCMVVKSDNTVWAWGRNTYGNLGDNTVTHRTSPVQMQGISDVAGMAAGTNFSLVYKDDGTLWGCGRNASGQLGDGSFVQHNILTQSTPICPIKFATNLNEAITENKSIINAYPNPSYNGIFHFSFPISLNEMNSSEISVFNFTGQKVMREKKFIPSLDGQFILDLSSYADGMYWVKMKIDNQTYISKIHKL